MRDNRFIELVNLYIDRQITAEETAELEAEMQANPRRRAIYKQYCQLHTATKQVYAGFRASSTTAQTEAPAGRVIRAEFARRRRIHWVNYAGAFAAAACLALVFVRYSAGSASKETAASNQAPAPVQVAAVTPANAAPMPAAIPGNSSAVEQKYPQLLKAMLKEEQRALAAREVQPSEIPSLFDDGVFDARPVLPAGNSQRVFRGKQTPKEAQFTAFEFQH